jgi:hypothetical protein
MRFWKIHKASKPIEQITGCQMLDISKNSAARRDFTRICDYFFQPSLDQTRQA